MNYFLQTLFIMILLFGGCRSSGKTQDSAETNMAEEVKSLKVLAVEKLGEGVKMESNESGDLVLCTNRIQSSGLAFFIYHQVEDSILFERNGFIQYVRWETDSTVRLRTLSSNPSVDKLNSEKIFNVRNGQELSPSKTR